MSGMMHIEAAMNPVTGREPGTENSGVINLTANESGREFMVLAAATFNLPPGNQCVIGETVFYFHSLGATFQVSVSGADRLQGLTNNEDGTFISNETTTMNFNLYQYAEFRYVASGKWALIGAFSAI